MTELIKWAIIIGCALIVWECLKAAWHLVFGDDQPRPKTKTRKVVTLTGGFLYRTRYVWVARFGLWLLKQLGVQPVARNKSATNMPIQSTPVYQPTQTEFNQALKRFEQKTELQAQKDSRKVVPPVGVAPPVEQWIDMNQRTFASLGDDDEPVTQEL